MIRQDKFDIYCKALDFMEERLFEKLSLNDVAGYCGVSVSGLEKIFQYYGNDGVMRSFLDMKLEHGAALLREDCAVSDIAMRLEFSSVAHFSAVFKKKHGIPPQKYKYAAMAE